MAKSTTEALARAVLLSGEDSSRVAFESLFQNESSIDASVFAVANFGDFTENFVNQLSLTNNPLVVVIAQDIATADAFRLSAKVDEVRPDSTVVWISLDKNPDAVAAMSSGIRAIIEPTVELKVLKSTVIEKAKEARRRWESVVANTVTAQKVDTRGSVITVISPKGGVGKTTVSTNLAVGLAKKAPNQVVLLDLDVQFGDVSSALGLTPTHTLLDIVKGPAKNDLLVLKSFITEHESGLRVIPAPLAPEEASQITAEEISKLIKTLVEEFEYVIVDTSPGFSEITLSSIELSSDTVIVSELDVPSLRGVRKALDVLIALNMPENHRRIVLNNMGRAGGLKVSDAKKLLSEPIAAEIPASSKVMYSTNEGVPVLASAKHGKAFKQLQSLVDTLARNSKPGAYTPNEGVVA